MELFIAEVLGVGNEAANQIFNIVMNAGSALSIASAIATLRLIHRQRGGQ